VQQVGYLADPMAKDSAEAEPMHQAKKRASPTVVVPRYLLHLTRSTQQVVEEPVLVRSILRPLAVELGFAHPMGRVVVEQAAVGPGFVRPTQRAVVVEQAFVPSLVFVVAEPGFVRPTQRAVVAEHSMNWVVDQVDSKNLPLVYFPVGSIPVVEPVVPDVANLKKQQQH
jgi:hypothetical protein